MDRSLALPALALAPLLLVACSTSMPRDDGPTIRLTRADDGASRIAGGNPAID